MKHNHMQDYYLEALGASRNRVMYLTPPARYVYQAPPRVTDGHGKMRKAGDRKTAPFPSFWYLDPEPALTAHSLLLAWRERRLGAASNCHLCLGTRQLPHKMRDAFDPLRKKLSKREREKMRKKTAADGRKLCKQCGQVRGLAYGMVFNVGHLLCRFCFFFVIVALTLAEWPTPLRRCMAFASTLGQCQLKQKLCRCASTTLAKACHPNVVNVCQHDRFYNWHCLLSITGITGMTVSQGGRHQRMSSWYH